jgi:hypothetical protein
MLTSSALLTLRLLRCCMSRRARECRLQEQFIQETLRATLNTASTQPALEDDLDEPRYYYY